MKDKNYLLITQDDVRKLVEIPVEGRIEAIGFTRYSELLASGDKAQYPLEPNGSYPIVSHEVFNELYGKILTVVDATFLEGAQKEAFKSIIKNEMSGWYDKNTSYVYKMTKQAYDYMNMEGTHKMTATEADSYRKNGVSLNDVTVEDLEEYAELRKKN